MYRIFGIIPRLDGFLITLYVALRSLDSRLRVVFSCVFFLTQQPNISTVRTAKYPDHTIVVTCRIIKSGMDFQITGLALFAILFFVIRYLNRTDIPKIKGLPEIPGVPIFGNLLQLGDSHARKAAGWVQRYGPVFQVRLGNKVGEKSRSGFSIAQ